MRNHKGDERNELDFAPSGDLSAFSAQERPHLLRAVGPEWTSDSHLQHCPEVSDVMYSLQPSSVVDAAAVNCLRTSASTATQGSECGFIDPTNLRPGSRDHPQVEQWPYYLQPGLPMDSLPITQQVAIEYTEPLNVTANQGNQHRDGFMMPATQHSTQDTNGRKKSKRRHAALWAAGGHELFHRLGRSLAEKDKELICDIYDATAGPESIVLLRAVTTRLRTLSNCNTQAYNHMSLLELWKEMDAVHETQGYFAFHRRILLLHMSYHRCVEAAHNASDASYPGVKPGTLVLDRLVREMFEYTNAGFEHLNDMEWRNRQKRNNLKKAQQDWRARFDKERSKILNRLHAARNWRLVAERFGIGILALIPTGAGDFQIQNKRQVSFHPGSVHQANNASFENLREESFQVLLNVLEEKGDGYVHAVANRLTQFVQDVYDGKTFPLRFAFEEADDHDIRKMDSSRILELCEASVAGEQRSAVFVNPGS